MSRSRGFRAALTALAAAATVGCWVAPAGAETQTAQDPTHDVVRVAIPGGDTSPATGNKSVDVVRLTTRHAGPRVRLVTEVRELGDHIAVQLRIRTPRGTFFGYVEKEGGAVFKGLSTSQGGAVCPHRIRAGVSDSADTVTFTVPRGCLDAPRWVRTGALTSTGNADYVLFDDARRTGSPDNGDIKLGPRIHHD